MDVELLVLTWRGTDNCTTFVAELQYRLSESGFIVILTRQTTRTQQQLYHASMKRQEWQLTGLLIEAREMRRHEGFAEWGTNARGTCVRAPGVEERFYHTTSERLAAIHFVESTLWWGVDFDLLDSQIDQRSEEKYRNGNSKIKHPDPYDVEE